MSDHRKDGHLSAEDIVDFILGELESDQEVRVFEHLDQLSIINIRPLLKSKIYVRHRGATNETYA